MKRKYGDLELVERSKQRPLPLPNLIRALARKLLSKGLVYFWLNSFLVKIRARARARLTLNQ